MLSLKQVTNDAKSTYFYLWNALHDEPWTENKTHSKESIHILTLSYKVLRLRYPTIYSLDILVAQANAIDSDIIPVDPDQKTTPQENQLVFKACNHIQRKDDRIKRITSILKKKTKKELVNQIIFAVMNNETDGDWIR